MTNARAVPLSAEEVLAELHTSWIGRSLRVLADTTSTIDVARSWLDEGAPDGAVVIAARQTAGRGRRGRVWASPPGGLWMSVIAHPDLRLPDAGRLGVALALACAESASVESECDIGVKWPNDLVAGGKKIGGVLAETAASGERVISAVLSAGLNVNFSTEELPDDVKESATTLLDQTGRTHSLARIAAGVLSRLETMWPTLREDGTALVERWRERDSLVGREVLVEAAGKMVAGRAEGIDESGALRLVSNDARLSFPIGEVLSVGEVQP